jgi:transcriptional regulator with XRE-family HTH domain
MLHIAGRELPTVPTIETLEKLARALEVPLYQLFYESTEPPKLPNLVKRKTSDDIGWEVRASRRCTFTD